MSNSYTAGGMPAATSTSTPESQPLTTDNSQICPVNSGLNTSAAKLPLKYTKLMQDSIQPQARNAAESDLQKYTILIAAGGFCQAIDSTARNFRTANKSPLPAIGPLALDLCCAPASESFCKRMLSVWGDLCARKRNKMAKSLEKKVVCS
jgi:hypothetical protein